MRSFPFFIKERNVLVGFISHTNIANLAKKNIKRMFRSFFDIYLYIYVYIYLYIFLYIYWKKNGTFSRSFANEQNVLAFFSILCKKGRDLYLDSGGGWFLHCSVFYEIRHFLHGRNIPWTICNKTDLKINCTSVEPHCNRCELHDNWRATGQVHWEQGPLTVYPSQRHLLDGCL